MKCLQKLLSHYVWNPLCEEPWQWGEEIIWTEAQNRHCMRFLSMWEFKELIFEPFSKYVRELGDYLEEERYLGELCTKAGGWMAALSVDLQHPLYQVALGGSFNFLGLQFAIRKMMLLNLSYSCLSVLHVIVTAREVLTLWRKANWGRCCANGYYNNLWYYQSK